MDKTDVLVLKTYVDFNIFNIHCVCGDDKHKLRYDLSLSCYGKYSIMQDKIIEIYQSMCKLNCVRDLFDAANGVILEDYSLYRVTISENGNKTIENVQWSAMKVASVVCEQYQVIKSMQTEIDTLKKDIEELKTMLYYTPGQPGAKDAEKEFQELSGKN